MNTNVYLFLLGYREWTIELIKRYYSFDCKFVKQYLYDTHNWENYSPRPFVFNKSIEWKNEFIKEHSYYFKFPDLKISILAFTID